MTSRRGFFRQAAGRQRVVTFACGRWFIHYMDAAATGRLDAFARAIADEIGSARELYLTEPEWLGHEGFRQTLATSLRRMVPPPTIR